MSFYITKVGYSKDRAYIEKVQIRRRFADDQGKGRVGPPRVVSAVFINDLLKTGKIRIDTATKEEGGWRAGEEVICYDDEYITTKSNSTEKDNLGGLPEF